jgi:hypothetical protein
MSGRRVNKTSKTQVRASATLLQRALVPLVLDAISHRQVWHQVTRQKFTWPLLPDLLHEILLGNFQVVFLDARGDLFDAWCLLRDDVVNILRGNLLPRVDTCAIFHPLPELHTSDLSSSRILHQVVDRNAAIAADPGPTVCQSHRDIGADAVLRDLSGNAGIQ